MRDYSYSGFGSVRLRRLRVRRLRWLGRWLRRLRVRRLRWLGRWLRWLRRLRVRRLRWLGRWLRVVRRLRVRRLRWLGRWLRRLRIRRLRWRLWGLWVRRLSCAPPPGWLRRLHFVVHAPTSSFGLRVRSLHPAVLSLSPEPRSL